ncbi:hypothetical protein [Chitinophaga eiseniae]|uniref:hypothetical protein n=1 Tax=Chitinophaga eiseniae TaxID=634771 RepID=UPI001F2B2E7F|nr:hypothetical protein [Chitinophaga eiseniae]
MLKKILWADFALGSGTAVIGLAAYPVLSPFLGLPVSVVVVVSAVTLLYALVALWLATRNSPAAGLVRLLMYANAFWTLVSIGLLVRCITDATIFGAIFLVLQVVVVGELALLEKRCISR